MAEENVLRNEFFEARVHPQTGGLQSIHSYNVRGNRLSQQLAYRLPSPRPQPGDVWRDPDLEPNYSTMVADALEITATGPAWGEIVSRGKLLSTEQKTLAEFTQTFRLERGSRVLQLDVELNVVEPPRADPWNSYFAARFAWADAAAQLQRSVGLTSQPTAAKRLEAPNFVEIRETEHRIALLTGGLPYHRYNTLRMLDTLLVVRGESQRRFRLGIAVDDPHPAHSAVHRLSPSAVVTNVPLPGETAGSGWLFHLDARNLIATHWQPLVEAGRTTGFRARLLETEGRAGRFRLRTLRAPQSARQIDFIGRPLVELSLEGDAVQIDVAAFEWIEVEVNF